MINLLYAYFYRCKYIYFFNFINKKIWNLWIPFGFFYPKEASFVRKPKMAHKKASTTLLNDSNCLLATKWSPFMISSFALGKLL